MPITPLPKTPNRSTSPETFADDGDNFLGALPTFATEANALAADVNAKQGTASTAASTATTKAGEASTSATSANNSATLASQWATKTGSVVTSSEYSAKEYASGTAVESAKRHASGTTATGSAKDWATKSSGEVVAGQGFSAKKYAADSSASATAASGSASAASTSASQAASSASSASTSAGTATTKASEAYSSASSASTSAGTATTKAGEAAASDLAAAGSASTASTKAGEASTSATQAATSAGTASTKAGEASSSAASALASSNNANAKYKLFDERYLGSKTADPTTDNNGQPLLVGSEYWNSTAKVRKVWTGTSWQVANLADAPNDGRVYARKSGAWVELSSHGTIGTPGQQGFGVGIYPAALPPGFSALPGTFDAASPNYGNYHYDDGSIMVFIPRFYYRIGHTSSPNYAIYGLNAIDIVGVDTFQTEDEANAAGYAMHRAFIDGGQVKSGFFVDKYICSKSEDEVSHGRSVKGGVPISLTTQAGYTSSTGMTGCVGQLHDAVTLSRARGVGVFNAMSIFMANAYALLSLAHGQAATSNAACAWYDAAGTTNFPKGCNGNNLSDANDPGVTYQSAGDSADAFKPRTGSASNLAKTTHNGQACGVADINGSMYQTLLGLTQAGSSATASSQIPSGDAYILKTSSKLADLTSGWGGATDAWGTSANLSSRYDLISGFLPWGAEIEWVRFGNGSNQVFSAEAAGTDYLRTCSGIAKISGYSTGGSNLYGSDGNFRYTRENLVSLAAGLWFSGSGAGAFYRSWYDNRSGAYFGVGFRAAAYGL